MTGEWQFLRRNSKWKARFPLVSTEKDVVKATKMGKFTCNRSYIDARSIEARKTVATCNRKNKLTQNSIVSPSLEG